MPMISYAQNREDVLVRRLFPKSYQGFYIDVGAGDPTNHSVTRHFYDRGWRGINIEPTILRFKQLCAERPRDINLNVGLSNDQAALSFFEPTNPVAVELSTFCKLQANFHRANGHDFTERSMPVTTLATICKHYVDQTIDFISIDVEAHERQVIEGGDWRRWRPRLLIIEAILPTTNHPTHGEWEDLLLKEDYLFAAFDGINRYYVRAEDRQLLPLLGTPVNFTDDYLPYNVTHTGLSDQVKNLAWELEQWQQAFAVTDAALKESQQRLQAVLQEPKKPIIRTRTKLLKWLIGRLDNPLIWCTSRRLLNLMFGLYRKRFRLLQRWGILDENPSVLDIGCGSGQYAQVTQGPYLGVDLNERYIKWAANTYRNTGRTFQCVDVTKLCQGDKTYNLVLMVDLLHHLTDEAALTILKAAWRLADDQVASFEPVKEQTNFVGQWIIDNDRGQHMRSLADLEHLFARAGLHVDESVNLYLGPILTRATLFRKETGVLREPARLHHAA